MRRSWLATVGLVLGLSSGCQSAQEKCEQARSAAHGEWSAYVQALEAARARTHATLHAAAVSLAGIDRRLLPLAQERADARYPRSSEAWLRASTSAYNELCVADAECRARRDQRREETAVLADLDERLSLARAARDAARGDADGASRASAAAILHPEYPQLKQAQARVAELRERCAGIAPSASEKLSSAQR